MFKRMCIIFVLYVSFVHGQTNVAVIDFLAKGVSPTDASIITDKFRNSVVNLGINKVYEREIVTQVLEEQGIQQTGIVSDESAVTLGKMIGAEQLISGSVSLLNDTFSVTAKLIDVENGEILRSTSIDHKGELDGILNKTDLLASKLFKVSLKNNSTVSSTPNDIYEFTPIQIAFIHPVQLFPETKAVKGMSVNIFYGKKASVYGVDLGVGNVVNNKMYGIQAGLVNQSQDVKGIQAGLINRGKKVKGLQVGLVNTADTMFGLQIGLVNQIKSGLFQFLPVLNMSFSF